MRTTQYSASFMKKIVFLFWAVLLCISVQAKTYYVKEGATITLQCTATAPQGYITHAVFEVADPSDVQYLALTGYNTSAQTATFKGVKAKANIKVNVTYYYSFKGTYSNTMQVGHGSYTDYVTVQAGVTATDIKINPSGINMKVGETVTAKVELVPSNASTVYNVGYIESISSPPSYFKWSFENGVFTITAKKAGKLYLVAQLSDKVVGTCIITATKDGDNATEPTSVELSIPNTSLEVGETKQIRYKLLPLGASTTMSWSSNNENVATVNSQGIVTAKGEGKVTVTATTANGIEKSIALTVVPKAQNVSLPSRVETTLGFAYQLEAKVTPANAKADCVWSSSNTDVATVSSTGKILGKKDGEVMITAKVSDTVKATTTVRVSRPSVIDHVNAGVRKAEIDALVNRTLFNITK